MYSVDDNNDYTIRAYSKCPMYNDALSTWYSSPEFLSKSDDTAAFRKGIRDQLDAFGAASSSGGSLDTSLLNWYNVYDAFNVYRTYGVGAPMPNISDADYAAVTDLGYWLEVW